MNPVPSNLTAAFCRVGVLVGPTSLVVSIAGTIV